MKKPKRISRYGKRAKAWAAERAQWFIDHPRDYYKCHYCGGFMDQQNTTLDHMFSRSRRPDLRLDSDNLVPCCYNCNRLKGSRSAEEFIKEMQTKGL